MILAFGTWADGRLFVVFDTHQDGRFVRTCWTPTDKELVTLRRVLFGLAGG